MKKVLFVCRGNMFRSQIAQAIFNAQPPIGWEAVSSGTAVQQEGRQDIHLSAWGKGIQITIDAMQKRYHIDMSDQFCKQVDECSVSQADKIIMMSEREFIPEWLNHYEWEYWQIPNPDFITPEIADEIMSLLDEKIAALKIEIGT